MLTKLGFSTGKGFLDKVDFADKATYADEATTDFTNAEWIEGTTGELKVPNEGTYQIKLTIDDGVEISFIISWNGTTTVNAPCAFYGGNLFILGISSTGTIDIEQIRTDGSAAAMLNKNAAYRQIR